MILGKARRGRVFAPAGALHLNRHLGVPRALQGRHRRSAGLPSLIYSVVRGPVRVSLRALAEDAFALDWRF